MVRAPGRRGGGARARAETGGVCSPVAPARAACEQPHPSKSQDPVSRDQLHNSVAKDSQKAGATTKKGGAGGKGTWGKVGDEYDGAPAYLNKKDPNYDPEEQGNHALEASE